MADRQSLLSLAESKFSAGTSGREATFEVVNGEGFRREMSDQAEIKVCCGRVHTYPYAEFHLEYQHRIHYRVGSSYFDKDRRSNPSRNFWITVCFAAQK
jgi:hypothetical protein